MADAGGRPRVNVWTRLDSVFCGPLSSPLARFVREKPVDMAAQKVGKIAPDRTHQESQGIRDAFFDLLDGARRSNLRGTEQVGLFYPGPLLTEPLECFRETPSTKGLGVLL
jgi:hypothetical protein